MSILSKMLLFGALISLSVSCIVSGKRLSYHDQDIKKIKDILEKQTDINDSQINVNKEMNDIINYLVQSEYERENDWK